MGFLLARLWLGGVIVGLALYSLTFFVVIHRWQGVHWTVLLLAMGLGVTFLAMRALRRHRQQPEGERRCA